jgi:hypothetical protein
MPRTTELAVSGIIDIDVDIPLDPFIEAASHLVTKLCAPHVSDAAELELVERWLAAHIFTVRSPRRVQEGVEGITETFQSKVDLGLDTSHYGQHAKFLDSSGQLALWDEKIKKGQTSRAQLAWLGSTTEEVRTYDPIYWPWHF